VLLYLLASSARCGQNFSDEGSGFLEAGFLAWVRLPWVMRALIVTMLQGDPAGKLEGVSHCADTLHLRSWLLNRWRRAARSNDPETNELTETRKGAKEVRAPLGGFCSRIGGTRR